MNTQISIIGRGVDPRRHLSLEALNALRRADLIIGIEPETEFWNSLAQEYALKPILDVSHLYRAGAKDLNNYQAFIEYILSSATEHQNIAVLVAGHPRLGVTFAQLLEKQTAGSPIDVHFIPGISSFDVMINELGVDPLERGAMIMDSNRLLLFDYNLDPAIDYFFYHVCSVATQAVNFHDPSVGNQIHRLQAHLERFFKPTKTIYLCRAANGSSEQSTYTPITLGDLTHHLGEIDFSTTLYVPSEQPTRLNQEYLEILMESAPC